MERRAIAIVGSLAVHVSVFAIGVATCASRAPVTRDSTPIELVDIQMVAPPEIVERAVDEIAGGGGGSPPAAPAVKRAPRAKPRPAPPKQPTPTPAGDPTPPASDVVNPAADVAMAASATANALAAINTTGSGGGIGGGDGIGEGSGKGPGIGSATGTGTNTGAARVKRVKPSRARPAKLLWPSRQREEVEEWVFVVMLTVDTDGGVVGAKLVHGHNFHDNEKAMDAVWRFHYAPALDDAGRPIRSKVRQRFMLR